MSDRTTSQVSTWLGRVADRVRERDFWLVQLGVAVAVLSHVAVEVAGLPQQHSVGAAVYLPPLLLLAPVAWASLRYGLEGGVLTSAWAAVLTVPNLLLWHPADFEWVGDLVFLAVVLALGVVVAVPVERERTERQRAQAAAARLHEVEQDRLRTYVQEVTLAQEAERARLARDLHDDVAQRLVVLVRHLDAIEEAGAPDDDRLAAARTSASAALAEVRRTSRDLRPTVLDDLGLSPALEWLADDLEQRSGIAATADVVGPVRRLDPPVELALFRIAQEALRNVERHAAATTASITVSLGASTVDLEVRDDGVGFEVPDDLRTLARAGRLGTIGMQERAELVGGRLEVRSAPGEGTTVQVSVPSAGAAAPPAHHAD